jgi:PAS domain S-box-containing protein
MAPSSHAPTEPNLGTVAAPPRPSRRAISVSRAQAETAAFGVAAAIGTVVLLGWATGADPLKRAFMPGVVAKANTGWTLTLVGIAAMLTVGSSAGSLRRAVSIAGAAMAGTIAIATLAEYATNGDFGIDNILFREAAGAPETAAAGRMAVGAAIGVALIAAAILPLVLGRWRSRLPAALALVVATLAGISLIGRLYGSAELTGLGAGTLIAPPTAIALAALAVGVLVHPEVHSPIEMLWRPTLGGRVARGFTIASVTILPLLGLIDDAGVKAGWFGTGFGVSVVIVVGAFALVTAGLVIASRFDRLAGDLETTAATLGAILDASPPAIVAFDARSRVTFWSRGAERLYGWTAAEVLGEIAPYHRDSLDDRLAGHWRRLRAGETHLREEDRHVAKNGELVDVFENTVPLLDKDKNITGFLSVQEDIRDRKRLEAELIEAHKMQTVGRLAGGIAHNFNNILTAIVGYTELVLKEPLAPGVRTDLEAVNTAAARAGVLTGQMLAFSRRQKLNEENLEVGEAIRRFEPMLRQLVGDTIELKVVVASPAASFVADSVQFEQVILNLALNARDAMPDGGRLVVRADRVSLTPANLPHADMRPGEHVVVSVSDNGHGMDAETQSHIFEPFFTTKEVGKGTGLGLATSYGIVNQMGGTIVVDSAPDQGSTFRLYFPAAEPMSSPPPDPAPTRRRILVVEDDPMVLDLTRRTLEAAGFEVLAAADGAEGLALAGNYGIDTVDMVVTDALMPQMPGVELVARLREIRSDIAIVYLSGYDGNDGDHMGERYIAKPFQPDALVRLVQETLDTPGYGAAGPQL